MTHRRLLELCARPHLSPEAEAALHAMLADFADWQPLAAQAEHERMVPLLNHHLRALGVRAPAATWRSLATYGARQRALAQRQQRVLTRVVQVCRGMGVEVLLLKGAALVHSVYDDATLRPMDDLDVLVPESAVDSVRQALLRHGFVGPPARGKHQRPHHAAPVWYSEDGVPVVVEVHRYFPAGGHAERWDDLRARARPCTTLRGAWLPHPNDLLWQVYHHAFRSSLRWVPWRLIWVADLVGLLCCGAGEDTAALRGLTQLHWLTPLPAHVLQKLGGPPAPRKHVGGVYRGWPHRKFSPRSVWHALVPPQWWTSLRHGMHGEAPAYCWQQHCQDLWHEWRHPWDGLPCR